jgi:hypothetical protein
MNPLIDVCLMAERQIQGRIKELENKVEMTLPVNATAQQIIDQLLNNLLNMSAISNYIDLYNRIVAPFIPLFSKELHEKYEKMKGKEDTFKIKIEAAEKELIDVLQELADNLKKAMSN